MVRMMPTKPIPLFTPLFDVVIDDLGLIPAAVFGRIRRYAQMKDKTCSASVDKIGKQIGISGRSVMRWLKVLCDKGYLDDLSPDRRNKPHIYRVTDMLDAMTLCQIGTTQSHSRYDRESVEETLKRHPKKEEKKERPKPIFHLGLAEAIPLDPDVPQLPAEIVHYD